jgi:hypothetical protein
MAVSDFECVDRMCPEESESGGHGSVGFCGLGRGEMHFVFLYGVIQLRLHFDQL